MAASAEAPDVGFNVSNRILRFTIDRKTVLAAGIEFKDEGQAFVFNGICLQVRV